MATPPGRLAPGGTWGPPAAWVGNQCRLSVSPEAARTRFSGVASTHTKFHVKSEGGMGWTKSRGANPARSRSRSTILSLVEVGKPHINIRWSDDGSDENERICRYRLDCGPIVSARGTPQPSENPPRDFHKKVANLRLCCALDRQTTAGTLRGCPSITP